MDVLQSFLTVGGRDFRSFIYVVFAYSAWDFNHLRYYFHNKDLLNGKKRTCER